MALSNHAEVSSLEKQRIVVYETNQDKELDSDKELKDELESGSDSKEETESESESESDEDEDDNLYTNKHKHKHHTLDLEKMRHRIEEMLKNNKKLINAMRNPKEKALRKNKP